MTAYLISLVKSRRFVWISSTLVVLISLYALTGFFLLPWLAKKQIPELIHASINRQTTIHKIEFNPFLLQLNVHEMQLDSEDKQHFAGFSLLHIDLNTWQSIKQQMLVVDTIALHKPLLSIHRDKQGVFNFSDLLADNKEEAEQSDSETFPVKLVDLQISEGRLDWHDEFYSQAHKESIFPLNLNLKNFTTLFGKDSDVSLNLKLGSGGMLSWQGEFSLQPLASQGELSLDGLSFPKLWEMFLQDSVHFEIMQGSEKIRLPYSLKDSAKGIDFKISNGQIEILDLQLGEKGKQDALITVPDVTLSGITLDLLDATVSIASVSSNKVSLLPALSEQGVLNLQTLFVPEQQAKSAAPSSSAQEEASPWTISVHHLALNDYRIQFTDLSLAEKPTLTLDQLHLSGQSLSSQADAPLPLKLSFKLNQSADIALDTLSQRQPLSSQVKLSIKKLAINDFQSYLNRYLNLEFVSGDINVDTNIAIKQADAASPQITVNGKASINNFVTRDVKEQRDLLKWKQLSLENIALDLAKQRYEIAKVALDKPYARVIIRKDKSVNLADIQKQHPVEATKPPAKAKTAAASPIHFKVARIELKNGISDFSDQSLILPFAAHINKLNGSIKDISSSQNKTAKINIKGLVADISPVNIKGWLNPYRNDSHISLNFESMPLPLATPYMAEFAGRKIEKGNMSLALDYTIKKQQLDASNELLIDQLVLGDEVENPKATALPLELAIALLEDSEGKINLDVPITGSLEDPEFSIGGIIIDALINVITKIVTAPFSALASLIDEDDDLSLAEFSAGRVTLSDPAQIKLQHLADALKQRPRLSVEIKGQAFSDIDWPALQDEALTKQLIQLQADKLSRESGKKVIAENITLSEEQYRDVLAESFIQKFPMLAERSLLGNPQLKDPKQGEFYSVAKQNMASIIQPDPNRLHQLAQQRAQSIAKFMVDNQIELKRIYVLDSALDPEETSAFPSAKLNLIVN